MPFFGSSWSEYEGVAEREQLAKVTEQRDKLLAAVKAVRDREFNPFEPGNQSKYYHDLNALIAEVEGKA